MESQLKAQVDLLERGTYQNLADLKEQIMLFAHQLFNNEDMEEEEKNREDLTTKNPLNLENAEEDNLMDDENDLSDDDEEFPEETDDSLGIEELEEDDEIENDLNEEDSLDDRRF